MKRKRMWQDPCIIFLFLATALFSQNKVCFAEVIELKVSHIGRDNDWTPVKYAVEPWARKVEQLSGGRIKFIFYPNQALGKPADQYGLAVDGTADISVSLLSYSPGRFPLSSVMELPFLSRSAERDSLIFWSLYQKYLKDEFKDVKVLTLFCHGPGHLHMVHKEIKTLEDLKGVKIRAGNARIYKALELLGAVPVQGPITDIRNLVMTEQIDGTPLPWEGLKSFDFYGLIPYHTEINMYTLTFFVVMNKDKYESLPSDIKKLIDENSGEVMASIVGRAMDIEDSAGRKIAIEKGQSVYTLPEKELGKWKRLALPVGDAWVEEMQAKGLPGQEVLNYVVNLSIQLQK